MADGYPLANRAGNSEVGVEDGTVLDVGVFTDIDAVGVGADYGGGARRWCVCLKRPFRLLRRCHG